MMRKATAESKEKKTKLKNNLQSVYKSGRFHISRFFLCVTLCGERKKAQAFSEVFLILSVISVIFADA
jgi:hypothetical protein